MNYYVIGECCDGRVVTDVQDKWEARNVAHKLSAEQLPKGASRFVVYETEMVDGRCAVRRVAAFRAGVELERW